MKNASRTKVAILVGHSLFAESIAQQLAGMSKRLKVLRLNPVAEDVFEVLCDFQPSVVIMDEDDADFNPQWQFLDPLIHLFPALKIIYLNSQHQTTRIISCGQRSVNKIQDLVDTIEAETASSLLLLNEITRA